MHPQYQHRVAGERGEHPVSICAAGRENRNCTADGCCGCFSCRSSTGASVVSPLLQFHGQAATARASLLQFHGQAATARASLLQFHGQVATARASLLCLLPCAVWSTRLCHFTALTFLCCACSRSREIGAAGNAQAPVALPQPRNWSTNSWVTEYQVRIYVLSFVLLCANFSHLRRTVSCFHANFRHDTKTRGGERLFMARKRLSVSATAEIVVF
jgi:hypothetical protein